MYDYSSGIKFGQCCKPSGRVKSSWVSGDLNNDYRIDIVDVVQLISKIRSQ